MKAYKSNGKEEINKKAAFLLVGVGIILGSFCVVEADTITVGFGPQYDFDNIQEAINNTNEGDEIVVADGTYTGEDNRNIDFYGKAITVRSENGPNNCIINCENAGGGFGLYTEEDGNSIIDGFTIRNALWSGIFCIESGPTIRNCTISDNWGYQGGGIYCDNSRATIIDCIISSNKGAHGGGIACVSSNVTIDRCAIIGNSGWDTTGGILVANSTVTMTNCLVVGNAGKFYGGSIACGGSILTVINCTFANNSTSPFGGKFLFLDSDISYVNISNCIVRNSNYPIRNENNSLISISYSDIEGGWQGEGNIDADPCFVETGYRDANGTPDDILDDFWIDGDYHLLEGSPCINTGDPNYVAESNETDLDRNPRVVSGRIDMGAYEYMLPIQAKMKMVPKLLNCTSKGRWTKAHFVLPEGILAEDINASRPAIAEPGGIESEYIKVVDVSGEPVHVEIGFEREAFCTSLAQNGEIEIHVRGTLIDGRYFEGTGVIKVRHND